LIGTYEEFELRFKQEFEKDFQRISIGVLKMAEIIIMMKTLSSLKKKKTMIKLKKSFDPDKH
jgi:hypothetical protein